MDRVVQPAQESPLLKLLAELRNRIYEYALVDQRPIRTGHSRYRKCVFWSNPALLCTCRQIRSEASSMYYSWNIFFIDGDVSESILQLRAWSSALERNNQSALQKIQLDDEFYCFATGACRIRECHSTLRAHDVGIPIDALFVEFRYWQKTYLESSPGRLHEEELVSWENLPSIDEKQDAIAVKRMAGGE